MKLKRFIKKYVARNTLIRLWKNDNGNHTAILKDNQPIMEWQILKDPNFNNLNVINVTDILAENYAEAVNIVVK